LIDGALAVFECAVEQQIDGGDHVIFLGRVCRAAYRDGDPLVFITGRYCTISPLVQDGPHNRADRPWETK
jgi:flavin reductase (DIM6/NTAB) family NADH-FMN oxidoreductase RutF